MGRMYCLSPGCKDLLMFGKFCTKCGSRLFEKAEKKCPKCKKNVSDSDRHCSNCGYLVNVMTK